MIEAEKGLIERLKRGEGGAQRELYEHYSAPLMAVALRYTGNRSRAEDLLHDAFITIFSSIKGFKYRGVGSLRAWMSRIVVNTALGELRRKGQRTFLALDEGLFSHSLAELTEFSEPLPPPETLPQEVLLQFIAELPDGYRTVFNLFCIEGYTHREIAGELGIKEKSSSSQLLRAKRILATKVNEYINKNE